MTIFDMGRQQLKALNFTQQMPAARPLVIPNDLMGYLHYYVETGRQLNCLLLFEGIDNMREPEAHAVVDWLIHGIIDHLFRMALRGVLRGNGLSEVRAELAALFEHA